MTSAEEKAAWAEAEKRATFLADLLERSADPDAARQAAARLVEALSAYRATIVPPKRAKRKPKTKEIP
jgi:hypothetical protein